MLVEEGGTKHPGMRRIVIFFILGLPLASAGRELTLDQAVDQALAGNRGFAASYFEVEKAQARALQAGLPRNPELEIGGRSDLLFKNEGERGLTLGVSQAIARKDRLRKAREAANLSVDQQRALVRDAERLLVGEVQTLYVRILTLDRQHRARQQLVGNGTRLADLIAQRYQAGEVPQTDIAPIRIENAKLGQEQALLLAEKSDAELKLKQLLGWAPEEPLSVTGELDEVVKRWTAAPAAPATDQRPDVQAAGIAIAQAKAEIEVAKAEVYDDVTVGVDFESERAAFQDPIGVKNDYYLGVKVSIPLPFKNKNQGRIAEHTAARRQAEAVVEAARQKAVAEVAQARNAVAKLGPILSRYREELIPLAENHFQAVQRAYQQGQEGIAPVFQAQQQRYSLELDYLTNLARQIEALIAIETAAGAHPHVRNHDPKSAHPHPSSQP